MTAPHHGHEVWILTAPKCAQKSLKRSIFSNQRDHLGLWKSNFSSFFPSNLLFSFNLVFFRKLNFWEGSKKQFLCLSWPIGETLGTLWWFFSDVSEFSSCWVGEKQKISGGFFFTPEFLREVSGLALGYDSWKQPQIWKWRGLGNCRHFREVQVLWTIINLKNNI